MAALPVHYRYWVFYQLEFAVKIYRIVRGEGKTQKWLALFAQANKGGWVCPGRKAFANSWSPIFTIREFERRSHLTQ
jgi:hypothetical protein